MLVVNYHLKFLDLYQLLSYGKLKKYLMKGFTIALYYYYFYGTTTSLFQNIQTRRFKSFKIFDQQYWMPFFQTDLLFPSNFIAICCMCRNKCKICASKFFTAISIE